VRADRCVGLHRRASIYAGLGSAGSAREDAFNGRRMRWGSGTVRTRRKTTSARAANGSSAALHVRANFGDHVDVSGDGLCAGERGTCAHLRGTSEGRGADRTSALSPRAQRLPRT
jgi:hypothetical protein